MTRDGGQRGGPPRLRFDLLHKLKVLLIANVIPFGIVAYVGVEIWSGRMGIRQDVPLGQVGFWVALLLFCCLVIGCSSWLVLPTVRWLRDYPAWHYRHASPGLWLLPMLAGWAIWLVTWMVMTVCAIALVALVAIGVWSLAEVAQATRERPPPTAAEFPPPPAEGPR